ncbi:MAG: chemotaxis protein CheA [Cyanomargarita calcarea GSE-NOS-MK-12-04C]|jgi:chemosensory pili system protein ChpA (sensor histidine kinase/response regulator)|uniref:histidine kinase n=1 Tax=Cyanomargarita calcarea GSE-NOS-MK-12-04C TaxID=2839659 RepID=A0A951UUY9_9CYAN|nr:chemotaxis protein CheA [Cyanomargarita calcarea GSE-NOS-MK-12-04C]
MYPSKELELKIQFLDEANHYLNTLEAVLLETKANRRIEAEKINAALRAIHSIKGGASIMGFRTLTDLAHRLEDSFQVLKSRRNCLELDSDLHSLLLSAIDWLRHVVELLSIGSLLDEQWLATLCYPVFEELHERLGNPIPEDGMSMLDEENRQQDIISLLFQTEVEGRLQRLESLLIDGQQTLLREEAMMMAIDLGGLGQMFELPAFSQVCQSITENLEAASSDEAIEKISRLALDVWQRYHQKWLPRASQALIIASKTDNLHTEIIPNLGIPVKHYSDYEQTDVSDPNLFEELLKSQVAVEPFEQINDLFGEIAIQRHCRGSQLEEVQKLIRNLSSIKSLEKENQDLGAAYNKFTTQITTFNNISELKRDEKLNLRSKTVTKTIVKMQEITTDIELSLEDKDKLNNSVTQVRMRPLSDIVECFPKALRDLNIEYGKNVSLEIEGGNTLIERSILEALREPLIHLLRNAFDHGIEDTATRSATGKPEQALIEIKATQKNNHTIITIRDDGRGISLDRIRRKAELMGLDASLLAQATDEELLSVIFEPGFSTKEEVTILSGRGVGMDVVRNNLNRVRGDVKVDTVQGVGTTFTLSVPLEITQKLPETLIYRTAKTPSTLRKKSFREFLRKSYLSLAPVVLAESKEMLLAFPEDAVEEILLLQNELVFSVAGSEVLNWQGTMIPLVRLGRYLEFNCQRYDNLDLETLPTINGSSVLIVKNGNQSVAVQLDRYWGEQEVTIRKVEGSISLPAGFDNCAILGDGRVVPLVKAKDLLDWIISL